MAQISKEDLIKQIRDGIIVSCQALSRETILRKNLLSLLP